MQTRALTTFSRPSGSSGSRRALEQIALGLLPVLVAGLAFYYAYSGGYVATDFQQSFLAAGLRELHGLDPYHWTRTQILVGHVSFPYPSLAVILFELFALLPGVLATVLYLVLSFAAVVGALYLLGVRDWRIYGATFLWTPVLIGWQSGNVTLLLMFGIAAAWRYRDRPWLLGLIAALLISIKPTMFPIGIWLIATRRYRATVIGAGIGLVLNLAAWTFIGWSELGRFLHLVSMQSQAMYHTGYSIIALAWHLGASRTTGTLIQAIAALLLLAGCVALRRKGREAGVLSLAVALCLVASPLIDQHYFALLVVPLALAFPRLRWPWVLPLALWLCPATGDAAWELALWLVVAATVVVAVIRALPHQDGERGDGSSSAQASGELLGATWHAKDARDESEKSAPLSSPA